MLPTTTAIRSMCSTARSGRNGVRIAFWKRLPRLREPAAGAFTCTCLKARANDAGWTSGFRRGVATFLDDIGFLSPRLAVAHGVQLRPDEIELLAERGVQLATNASANLRLRSGIAPLMEARQHGLDIAIGLDGTGIDDDQDLWREMRLVRLLHNGRGMEGQTSAAQIFASAMEAGRTVTGFDAPADLTIVSEEALAGDCLFDDIDLAEVMMTRMTAGCATGLIVGGNWVMRDGRLVGVDFEAAEQELMAQARADLPRLQTERKTADRLAGAIKRHYSAIE